MYINRFWISRTIEKFVSNRKGQEDDLVMLRGTAAWRMQFNSTLSGTRKTERWIRQWL